VVGYLLAPGKWRDLNPILIDTAKHLSAISNLAFSIMQRQSSAVKQI